MNASYISSDLLGGKVSIFQPQKGYRTSIDAIILAAATPARAGQCVLDAGCGPGAVALCLNWRVKGLKISAVEIYEEHAELARLNFSKACGEFKLFEGDLRLPPKAWYQKPFDHVMTNPPYFDPATSNLSPDPGKLAANHQTIPIDEWIAQSLKLLKSGGIFTIIHPASSLKLIVDALSSKCGNIEIFPIYSKMSSKSAKRVVIRAKLSSKSPLQIRKPLFVHEEAGGYTEQLTQILEHGTGLE